MAKEEKTLSEQDRKRIEQEAEKTLKQWQSYLISSHDALFSMAEYEHKVPTRAAGGAEE